MRHKNIKRKRKRIRKLMHGKGRFSALNNFLRRGLNRFFPR